MKDGTSIVSIREEIGNYDVDNIKNLIYSIRGKQVMLDSDVAMLYHIARDVSIRIMDAFVEMRKFILNNGQEIQ